MVLGIDPGSRACGYGIIVAKGSEFSYLTSGRLMLSVKSPLHVRLRELHKGLGDVISEFGPTIAVIEKVFFAKSAHSALSLGQARGVALLSASESGLSIFEYTAVAVKKAVTGYGRAEKKQVQQVMKSILGIRTNLSSDGADALALALCHINTLAYATSVGLQ